MPGILPPNRPNRWREDAVQSTPEVEAFIRWLAMNPHKMEDYMMNPDAFLAATNLGDEAGETIRTLGPSAIRRAVNEMAEEVYSSPEAAMPNTYGRDETVRGFGAKR